MRWRIFASDRTAVESSAIAEAERLRTDRMCFMMCLPGVIRALALHRRCSWPLGKNREPRSGILCLQLRRCHMKRTGILRGTGACLSRSPTALPRHELCFPAVLIADGPDCACSHVRKIYVEGCFLHGPAGLCASAIRAPVDTAWPDRPTGRPDPPLLPCRPRFFSPGAPPGFAVLGRTERAPFGARCLMRRIRRCRPGGRRTGGGCRGRPGGLRLHRAGSRRCPRRGCSP